MWEGRYAGTEDYVYGVEPNDFLRQSIDGLPPDMVDPPSGCAFAPRCGYQIEQCVTETPPLEFVSPTHRVACWRWEHVISETAKNGEQYV